MGDPPAIIEIMPSAQFLFGHKEPCHHGAESIIMQGDSLHQLFNLMVHYSGVLLMEIPTLPQRPHPSQLNPPS